MTTRYYLLDGVGEIELVKSRRARRYSITISSSLRVRVTVPFIGTFTAGETLARDNADIIGRRIAAMETRVKNRSEAPENQDIAGKTPDELTAYAKELNKRAHKELPVLLHFYAERIGAKYNRLFIKHNRSNWGSCSVRRNINLNINLMRLPEDLKAYVILHELTHLKFMHHGTEFHSSLQRACELCISPDSDEKSLSRRLKQYILV